MTTTPPYEPYREVPAGTFRWRLGVRPLDLADWLVRTLAMPFRDAHHVTGALVKMAEQRGCGLEDLSLDDMRSIEKGITDDVFGVLGVDNSVASRRSFGGTAPENVARQVKDARARWL